MAIGLSRWRSGTTVGWENQSVPNSLDRRGLLYTFGAYGLWGLFPILMAALEPANAFEITAHRALWSLLACALAILIARRWRQALAVMRDKRTMLRLTAAALLIGLNWGVMVYAVVTDRVASTSLGYYINPLLTVALGVVFLGERLRRIQVVAIAIAAVAVAVIWFEIGEVPWIALVLAGCFALYALIKNRVGPKVDALTGMAIETAILTPLAIVTLWLLYRSGDLTFFVRGPEGSGLTHDLLMIAMAVWTAGVLIIFAAGAKRVPLYMVGLIQYLTPTMTFILALVYFHEPMPPGRWIGFALVWIALTIITVDTWRRRPRRPGRGTAQPEVTEPL